MKVSPIDLSNSSRIGKKPAISTFLKNLVFVNVWIFYPKQGRLLRGCYVFLYSKKTRKTPELPMQPRRFSLILR